MRAVGSRDAGGALQRGARTLVIARGRAAGASLFQRKRCRARQEPSLGTGRTSAVMRTHSKHLLAAYTVEKGIE